MEKRKGEVVPWEYERKCRDGERMLLDEFDFINNLLSIKCCYDTYILILRFYFVAVEIFFLTFVVMSTSHDKS